VATELTSPESPDPVQWPVGTPVEIARTARKRKLRDWQLVLYAAGVPHLAQDIGPDSVLFVPAEQAARARRELEQYEDENRGWPRADELPEVLTAGSMAVAVWAGVLIVADQLARFDAFGRDWRSAGRSDAVEVRGGEWWRALTALTLHDDFYHLAGNLLFGAVFVGLASQVLGSGLALAATLAAGTLGNLANAWLRDGYHASIGASTAVFGALGVLVGHRALHRLRGKRARWLPLMVGGMLLLWLGVGSSERDMNAGERIDVLAHVLGFAAGAVLGALRALVPWQPARGQQILLGVLSGALLVLAWTLALR
jgi:membrane associated rhomboid family serine protease